MPKSAREVFRVLSGSTYTPQEIYKITTVPPRTIRFALNILKKKGLVIEKISFKDMRKRYLKNDGDPNSGFFLASVSQETVLLGLSQFSKNLEYGGNAVVPDGVIGKIFGMPVVVHNGLADKELYLCSKESIGFGFQKGIAMDEQPANQYGVGAKRVAMDVIFGCAPLHVNEKSSGAGNSALIFALND